MWEGVAQLANGPLKHRMADVAGDLAQWLEHEPALVQGRMGNDELAGIHHRVTEQQDIDVDGPRALGLKSAPAHGLFEGEDSS